MKISRLKLNCSRALALAVSAIVIAGSISSVQADQLNARPLTPQEIHDNHLAAGTIASGGLFTVGVDEPVYLEALIDKDKTVTGAVMWYLTEAPNGSAATIAASPIPMDLPIYSPRKREDLSVADRKMFVPDVAGSYLVEAVVPTDAGAVELSVYVSGANYTGSGLVNDPAWGGPFVAQGQCAACHIYDADGKVGDFMQTGHATFLEEAIDGIKSSHYREDCLDCHVLGGHNPAADNGSFAATARDLGWTWPTVLQPGNWAAMPMELKAKANIQCEHCHGAGSEHYSRLNKNQTSISLNSGDCGQCHDEEPYHNKNRQWELSGHSRAPARDSGSCVDCHTGDGFINLHNDGVQLPDLKEALVCSACHDPHSNDGGEHQLRNVTDVAFENGVVPTLGGNGMFCLNCHKARRDADEYVKGSVSSHYGPHYGIQGDLFHGTNAFEYDGKVTGMASVHAYVVQDSCVGCHMQSVPSSHELKNKVGEHTFNMGFEGQPMTAVCNDCHNGVEDFDMKRFDYNYDGKVEGLQTEVHHLLEALAMKLHPVGSPEVRRGDSSHTYSAKEKKALYNYLCVKEDGSFGIHNPTYITELLRASITDLSDPLNDVLGGLNVPTGGPWFYSSWFDFYSPTSFEGWIYHVTHGYLYVGSDDSGNLLIYDNVLGKWLYTNEDLYPILMDVGAGTWMYFQGRLGDMRYFYNYGSGQWDIVK